LRHTVHATNSELLVVLVQPVADESERSAWIAARFDGKLPPTMNIGDGREIGGYFNRPLTTQRAYKIFVRAFTIDNVSCIVATISPCTALFYISIYLSWAL